MNSRYRFTKRIPKLMLSLLLISVFCCTGCSSGCFQKNTTSQTPAQVSSSGTGSGTQSVVAVVEKPLIQTQKATDPRNGDYYITEYDKHGNVLYKGAFGRKGSRLWSETFTYDANDNLLTQEYLSSNGKKNCTKKIYNSDGNLLEVYEGDDWDDLHTERENIYEDGILTKEIWYEDEGGIWEIYYYEYENDLLTVKRKCSEDDYEYRRWTYTYDENGVLTMMTDVMYEHKTVEFYDEAGNVLRREYYAAEDKLSGIDVCYYGPYGLEESFRYDENGYEESHGKSYYDDNGNCIKTVDVDKKGKEQIKSISEYDEAGNLLHSESNFYYEYTAEYNEFGYITMESRVDNNPLRGAGPIDELFEYEYVYFAN